MVPRDAAADVYAYTKTFEATFPKADAAASANTGNLYTVVKVGVDAPSASTGTTEDRFYFVVDKAINWDGSATAARSTSSSALATVGPNPVEAAWLSKLGDSATVSQNIGLQMIVKFDTSSAESYEYVAQCSGRGLCNEGNCECFAGYTGDNCNLQSALAS